MFRREVAQDFDIGHGTYRYSEMFKYFSIFRVANIAAKIWLLNLGSNFGYLKGFFSLQCFDKKLHDVC